ncbi:hypothetical protein WJX74_010896 [Apatococcus lobatus]|uniref:Cilia- and flagella-associated protein 126 n=2 Tax=Apatococcus TaxID=904362 RepID=A0AAW1SYB9_9CHLO
MSRSYAAEQFDADFIPHRLNNWEVPASKKATSAVTNFDTLKPRTGRTGFVAGNNGRLLPGIKKRAAAFNIDLKCWEQAPARWPKANPCINKGPNATMGYRGIPTSYLFSSTVTLPAVEVEGCKERLFQ